MDPVDQPVMLGAFLRGLRDEVKAELRILGPKNLGQAMAWSDKIDKKLAGTWLRNYPFAPQKYQNPMIYPNNPPPPNYLSKPKIP